ncbi:MAG: serine/threonine protein kinase [Prevotella sp.]|nr:serine/threonine protein kinase [Prevotella sp.]
MQHLQPNTTLQGGKYRIERVLGQGGFGITYLATQLSLQREVAIKEFFMKDFCSRDEATQTMLTPSLGSSRLVEQYRKKFIKEARNLARLNHPHIISVIDVFEENDTVYYVMPYLSGGSLQDYVKTHGTFSEQEAMKYVKQIASALKYMHEEEHICHYDVKPANILLNDKGNTVLIDFGISKNYDAQGQETTTTPIGMSEGYAPIEQYQQNVEEFSPVSDVYALGATLYFLLHGKRPVSAVHRASGTELLMSKQLSQGVKDIINASMKVSKRERTNSVDIFLGNVTTSSYRNRSTVHDYDESTIIERQVSESLNTSYTQTYASSPVENTPSTHNNSMIGWIVGITIVVLISFFILNNQGSTDKSDYQEPSNMNAENVQVSTIRPQIATIDYNKEKTSKPEKYDWSGNYSAIKDAGSTYGGTPIYFETTFVLKKDRDDYYIGTMEINGYQTMYDVAKIEGYVYNNKIRIFFKSSNDEGMNKWSDICTTNNAPLLTLTKANGQIEAEWFATLCEAEVVDQTTSVTKNE